VPVVTDRETTLQLYRLRFDFTQQSFLVSPKIAGQMNQATVLIVDDNETLLRQAVTYLTQRGFNVISHNSPFGVGVLLLRHRPDVAVLDVMMPGLDGGNLVEALSQQGPLPPIVFYSAMEEEQLYQLCKARPGTSYVIKSDGLDLLYQAITDRLRAA
jgi:two-component system OmpR family response regulator